MMSARSQAFRAVLPFEAPSQGYVPITDVLARALTYRHCEALLVDPFGVSVLGHFAMLHRLNADALLPHAPAVLELAPDRRSDLAAMRAAVAQDGQRWLDAFLASEWKLRRVYRSAIATSGAASDLNRLLRSQEAMLQRRLQEVFAEMSSHILPFCDDDTPHTPTRKGD